VDTKRFLPASRMTTLFADVVITTQSHELSIPLGDRQETHVFSIQCYLKFTVRISTKTRFGTHFSRLADIKREINSDYFSFMSHEHRCNLMMEIEGNSLVYVA